MNLYHKDSIEAGEFSNMSKLLPNNKYSNLLEISNNEI